MRAERGVSYSPPSSAVTFPACCSILATAPIDDSVDGDTLSKHTVLSIIVRQMREARPVTKPRFCASGANHEYRNRRTRPDGLGDVAAPAPAGFRGRGLGPQ